MNWSVFNHFMERAFQILVLNFCVSTCEIYDLFNKACSIPFGTVPVTLCATAIFNMQADTNCSAFFHFKIYGLLCVSVNTCVWTIPIKNSKNNGHKTNSFMSNIFPISVIINRVSFQKRSSLHKKRSNVRMTSHRGAFVQQLLQWKSN